MAELFQLIKGKWVLPSDPTTKFTGKNVIVTGSNVGLGLEAALKFVALGASKVILAVRSLDKGEASKGVIEAKTGKKDVVEVWKLDMLSYDSIKDYVKQVEHLDHLDIAVLNAGVAAGEFSQSSYEWETTIQVNTLSTTLLAFLLLPKLKASKTPSSTPVLEIVSSGTARMATISTQHQDAPLEAYNNSENFSSPSSYGKSKYFVQCAVKELAKFVEPTEGAEPSVIVTSVCPGPCQSDLSRNINNPVLTHVLVPIFFLLFGRTSEAGSRTLVSGTVQGAKVHGKFWKDDRVWE
jgi:NAD(P)-dependent dehydrogenase (short-subunit alcohol dehydrogenase family)